MTPLVSLWLPIVLNTVLLFVVSSIIHTVLPWHKSDFRGVPDEGAARRAIGPLQIPPGDYMLPHCTSMKEVGTPEYQAKLTEGPVAFLTVFPLGQRAMAPMFISWALVLLAASILIACVAAAALAPGASRNAVWHLTGVVGFGIYAFGSWPQSIWLGRKWSSAVKDTFDAAIYGAVTALTFGWCWPVV